MHVCYEHVANDDAKKKMTLTAALFLYDPWNVIRKTQKLEISDA